MAIRGGCAVSGRMKRTPAHRVELHASTRRAIVWGRRFERRKQRGPWLGCSGWLGVVAVAMMMLTMAVLSVAEFVN